MNRPRACSPHNAGSADLALPAEQSDSGRAGSFEDRHVDDLAALRAWLRVHVVRERRVADGLYEPDAEERERRAERHHVREFLLGRFEVALIGGDLRRVWGVVSAP
jgi:hypothetical protein